jgi:hypothetical protein
MTRPSLLIGSDTLGWQEFADAAQLGTMTRAMPGGDGSLDFSLPGLTADKRRNVLAPGSECVLTLPGDSWAGLVVGEPMAGFVRSQPRVEVAAAGLWAHAAYRRDLAYVWADSEPGEWFRTRQRYDASDADGFVEFEDQGKFSVDTEGRLFIRGDSDRTYAGYSRAALVYWLSRGMVDAGCRIVGVDLTYKSNFPTNWRMTVRSGLGTPWEIATTSTLEESDTTSRSSWRSLSLDLTQESTSLYIALNHNTSSADSPATDPWIKVSDVTVYCRMDGASVDRVVTLDDAICDLATLSGLATVTRSGGTLGTARPHLVLGPDEERSVADAIRELASMHADPLEYFFDRAAGAWRFTLNEAPAVVDPTRNRHWVLDDRRAGESSEGVVRDYESAPEYVRVTYLSYGKAGVPDGTPVSYCYPSEPTSFRSHVVTVTDHAEMCTTEARAAAIAERIYEQRAATSFAGSAQFGATATTVTGQELPSYMVRPGDRVNIPGRSGARDIYVAETAYDFGSETMSATLGWPMDTLPFRSVQRQSAGGVLGKVSNLLPRRT